MNRIVIFGNSGSGKSTLAKKLAKEYQLSHLDLDTLAWQDVNPPERLSLVKSKAKIDAFLTEYDSWVIEGCYSDLLEMVLLRAAQVIFLDLSIELCIANAKNRPWEPHKYPSKAEQDANLEMLIEWIKQYNHRQDTFSKQAHQKLFETFQGKKQIFHSNESCLDN